MTEFANVRSGNSSKEGITSATQVIDGPESVDAVGPSASNHDLLRLVEAGDDEELGRCDECDEAGAPQTLRPGQGLGTWFGQHSQCLLEHFRGTREVASLFPQARVPTIGQVGGTSLAP